MEIIGLIIGFLYFYLYLFYVFSNAGSFLILKVLQFYLKLSYPIEKLFLFPAGFELRILLLAFDANTLTDWATAHSKSQAQYPVVLIASIPTRVYVWLIFYFSIVCHAKRFLRAASVFQLDGRYKPWKYFNSYSDVDLFRLNNH